MDKHENIIKIIKEKYIGIDYSEGEDMTVLWIYGIQAEDTIKALEKQIPTIPNYSYDECYECSNCYTSVKKNIYSVNGKRKTKAPKYCNECGQKIDWSYST